MASLKLADAGGGESSPGGDVVLSLEGLTLTVATNGALFLDVAKDIDPNSVPGQRARERMEKLTNAFAQTGATCGGIVTCEVDQHTPDERSRRERLDPIVFRPSSVGHVEALSQLSAKLMGECATLLASASQLLKSSMGNTPP